MIGSVTSRASRTRPSIAPPTATTCCTVSNRRDTGWRMPLMRKRYPFDYAIVRVVPRVDRGEFLNAGVILFSSTAAFLGARIACDHKRLRALAPAIDTAMIDSYLDSIPKVCAGTPDA